MYLPTTTHQRLVSLTDILAVLLAGSLPWSTSLTSILAVLWVLTFLPTCDLAKLQRIVLGAAGGLPVLLVALGAIGMLWADIAWAARANGIGSFLKLLFIPLLMCHFAGSDRAKPVLIGFLLACTALMLLSWALFTFPTLPIVQAKGIGIPVKDYISQGAMFTICVAILVYVTIEAWNLGRRAWAGALIMLAIAFLANVFYVATSRTSLVVVPVLLVVFGYRRFGWKGIAAAIVAFAVLVAAAWPSAGYLRERVELFVHEVQSFQPDGRPTPAGERLVYWSKSLDFIKAAPIIGHGTGSIRDQFERSIAGRTGMAAEPSNNPHNQILAVGIQLGFVGIIVLIAMWLSHLALFSAAGLTGWVGLVVVIQNVLGSQFNSHLFDFTHGWAYVVGVGIAGGAMLRRAKADALPG